MDSSSDQFVSNACIILKFYYILCSMYSLLVILIVQILRQVYNIQFTMVHILSYDSVLVAAVMILMNILMMNILMIIQTNASKLFRYSNQLIKTSIVHDINKTCIDNWQLLAQTDVRK